MAFVLETLDIEITRGATESYLRWPEDNEAEDDSGLGGNREYADFRGMSWQDVEDTLLEETDLLERLLKEEYPEEALDEEIEEFDEPWPLFGLDIGVASAVVALSAAGCIPAASCNGGALGRRHHERYPLVLFCARRAQIPLLLRAAEAAAVGLDNADGGYLILYANDLLRMIYFARRVAAMRREFDALTADPQIALALPDSASQRTEQLRLI